MSRPHVTDEIIDGLDFARACVLDQRAASHARKESRWDERYTAALHALDVIVLAHKRAAKRETKHVSSKKRAKT